MITPPSDIGPSQEVSHIAFLLPPKARGGARHERTISAYWDIGILEYWDTGNIGILGFGDFEILGYWNIGITHSIVMRRTELDRVMPWREWVQ